LAEGIGYFNSFVFNPLATRTASWLYIDRSGGLGKLCYGAVGDGVPKPNILYSWGILMATSYNDHAERACANEGSARNDSREQRKFHYISKFLP
jgi:hypothetical protein